MSRLLDIVNSPWAIEPAKLNEIVNIYSAHVRGEKIDLKAIEAQLGRPLNNEPKPYEVRDGVAVIPVDGVISPKMNLFTRISGGTSTQMLSSDFAQALEDSAVHSIVLLVDSPGGAVAGIQQLAGQIFDARGAGKKIVTLADGGMMSAAYWIGAAASSLYMADQTTMVGSIGVVTQHVDVSKAEEQAGVKTTEIYAGKYKRIASEYEPLSADGRAELQAMVDDIYTVFVNDVARFRGVTADAVLKDMADGRIFIGQKALDAKLVDGVSTLGALIAKLNAGDKPARTISLPAGAAAAEPRLNAEATAGAAETEATTQPHTQGTEMINRDFLLANHADLVEAFRAEGFTNGKAEGLTAGADAERARILAVEAQSLPGHEALITKLKADGKTTGPEAAVMVLAADKATGARRLAALNGDGAAVVVPAATAPAASAAQAAVDADLPVEERCKATWDKDAAIRAEFGNYDAFLAYTKADEAGRVKTLGKK
jgi:signal peptide peptidase SppA